MEKLKMHSPNLTDENIAKIREMFPGCVTEAKDENGEVRYAVDFDQLRQELSDHIVEGPQERYRLDWPGKREALLAANAPISKTLRPCRDESVDFDTTKNLFIEGDNLDALKVLQKSYLGKIKMIYIDPPYNTGGDFVYLDDFSEDVSEYLKKSNQLDNIGNKLVANTESNGRFHSVWLSMLYSRLRIARSLLRPDGCFFMSIDDNEVHNARKMLDEIYGEDNFVNCISVKMSEASGVKMSHVSSKLPKLKEYILFYRRSSELNLNTVRIPSEKWNEEYKEYLDNISKEALDQIKSLLDDDSLNDNDAERAQLLLEPAKIISAKDAYKKFGDNMEFDEWRQKNSWRIVQAVGSASVKKLAETQDLSIEQDILTGVSPSGKLYLFKRKFNKETKSPRIQILFADQNIDQKAGDFWSDIKTTGGIGAEGGIIFPNGKKPLKLLKRLIDLCTSPTEADIILDYFAGSSSTAHAVLEKNAEDGGNRKYVMVQLPEICAADSEHAQMGFKTVSEISKERIKRSGTRLLEQTQADGWTKDVGFRALKIDTSNMSQTYYTPEKTEQDKLLDAIESVKHERTDPEDLLFQVLIDWGVDLTFPIRTETIQGKTVFFVNDAPYDLVACFDRGVTDELVKELAKHEPMRVVFRDNGFVSDAVKINVEQIFKQLSPSTDVKSI